MNGGHSLSAMLLANPRLTVHVFDLFKWQYSWPVFQLLNSSFPGRLTPHPGYTQDTLAPWAAEAKQSGFVCDIALVDGGHTQHAALHDMRHLAKAARNHTRLVIDDIGMQGPGMAVRQLNASGYISIDEIYGPFPRRSKHSPCMRAPAGTPEYRARSGRMCPTWGFAVARYTHPEQ